MTMMSFATLAAMGRISNAFTGSRYLSRQAISSLTLSSSLSSSAAAALSRSSKLETNYNDRCLRSGTTIRCNNKSYSNNTFINDQRQGFHSHILKTNNVISALPSTYSLQLQHPLFRTYNIQGQHSQQSNKIPLFTIRSLTSTTTPSSSSSSFSSLPPDEENAERQRVSTLSSYAREMELRQLDSEIARLQTLRGINTGELYTLRGKFKMLSRDYGMGFLAWYWTVWSGTAALSYLAMEVGGIDPMMVASKLENFMNWEVGTLSGRLDPTLGQIGLVVAMNECLEPLRLPFVVITTKPVVNFFSRRG